jgi:molybdopterin converting factor small subunit
MRFELSVVKVLLSAHLRTLAGCDHFEVSIPQGSTVAAVIIHVASLGGESLAAALLEGDQPRGSLMLFLNDEHVFLTDIILEGQELTLIAPISGG